MSADLVIRNISQKLRYYLEVEKREEGFVTSLKKHKKSQPTKRFSNHVHDRSVHHFFNSQQAQKLLAYIEENSQLSAREKEVRSMLVHCMIDGEIAEPAMTNSDISYGFSKSEKMTNICRERKHYEFLGSAPKAEAERLITVATKLYATTEMLLNNEYYHIKQKPNGNWDRMEECSIRNDTEETETITKEFHIPDIQPESQSESYEIEKDTFISQTDVKNNVEQSTQCDLSITKIVKDVSCQTESWKQFAEADKKTIEESDIESGVHVFTYNSSATRLFSANGKQMESSSSQSTNMSEDSNYCDETYSDEDGSSLSESSEITSIENAVTDIGINQISMMEKYHSKQKETNIMLESSPQKNQVKTNDTTVCETMKNISDLSNIENETCSTCNSDSCSCNSCNKCQDVFIIKPSTNFSECSTCTCSCSSDESTCNEKGIDYEKQNKHSDITNDINNEKDIINNTMVAVQEVNTEYKSESTNEQSENEDTTAERKEEETDEEENAKHPAITRQITSESWDSQLEDEEAQIFSIHEASKNGDLKVVEFLSKANRRYIETVDERGWTPIHLAAANGYTEIVKYLALEGAHISALDPSGYTALHISAMRGHKDCMEALLEAEANIESITSDGFTALHLAALNNHINCCKTLLAWGASLKNEDSLGRTVIDLAEEYSLKRVKKFLQNFHKQLEKLNNNNNNNMDAMEMFSDKK